MPGISDAESLAGTVIADECAPGNPKKERGALAVASLVRSRSDRSSRPELSAPLQHSERSKGEWGWLVRGYDDALVCWLGSGPRGVSRCAARSGFHLAKAHYAAGDCTLDALHRPRTPRAVVAGLHFSMRSRSNLAGAVDAPVASLFHVVRLGRRATDQCRPA